MPVIGLDWYELPKTRGQIYSFHGWVDEMLRYLPERIFDTITAFRILELEESLLEEDRQGISSISRITRALKPNGYFIGSGSFRSKDAGAIDYLPPQLKLIQYIELPNPAPTGTGFYPFSPYHMGMILKKS